MSGQGEEGAREAARVDWLIEVRRKTAFIPLLGSDIITFRP